MFGLLHTLAFVLKQTTIRAARERLGWDQKTLSQKSGVDQSTISRLEAGITMDPSMSTVRKLEETLGLRRGTLVFGADAEQLTTAKAS